MQYYEEYWRERKGRVGGISPIEISLFAPYFASNALCLDYGCGSGARYGVYLRDHGIQYRGFDISAEAVAQTRAAGLDAELLTQDGKTTLPDGSCDFAVCFEVFEHLLEPHVALAEIRRVLSPSGVLLASVPNAAYWFQRCEFLVSGFFNPGGSLWTARKKPWADPHIRFFSPTTFRRFFLESGFGYVEVLPAPFTLEWLPYVYRKRLLKQAARYVSKPFGWLSKVSPGLFSGALYARAFPTIAPARPPASLAAAGGETSL
jgi:SAM-dependent methyltransferase